MFQKVIRYALLLTSVLVVACSDEPGGGAGTPTAPTSTPGPTAPPPPSGVANISGSWVGAFGFQQNGIQSNPDLIATISQNDRTVSGAIQLTTPGWAGWRASINGLLAGNRTDTQFVGTIEMTTPSSTGTGICSGQATFAGKSVSNSIRWDAQSITLVSNVSTQPTYACRGTLLLPAWILFR